MFSPDSPRRPRKRSRRNVLKAFLASVATLPFAACSRTHAFSGSLPSETVRKVATPSPSPTPGPQRIVVPRLAADGIAIQPNLRDKIGRMVLTGFVGLEAGKSSPVGTEIVNREITGVVLFDYNVGPGMPRNIASPGQLRTLTTQLEGLSPRPLIIAVDEEGGAVARLSPSHGFPATVSAAYLGALNDVQVTYDAGRAIARTLAAEGLNLNFAPVVDLNINPANPIIGRYDRSFSADPDVVTRNAEAFIRAHHDQGIPTTLKHFPGHGSSTGDSHLGFVDITDTWTEAELEPFANIVADGLADVIMVGHLYNANFDPDWPASLSHKTVTGVLREQLGYDGVVITDSMGMAAITDLYSFETAVQQAIEAGVDILLYASPIGEGSTAERFIDHVESLVLSGVIKESRIDESLARIDALEARFPAIS